MSFSRLGVEVRLWSLIAQKRAENFASSINVEDRQTNSYVNSNMVYSSTNTANSTNNISNINNNLNRNNNNNNNNSVALINHKSTRSSLRRNSNKRCDSEYDSCSE